MLSHVKLSLFVFSVLTSASIPITFIYLSEFLPHLGSHIILGVPCSWILLWGIRKKVPPEIASIVMPIGYLALVITAFLSLLGFGRLFDELY